MKTKHIVYACIISLFVLGAQLKAQTVYITDSGKKYHAKNCTVVKTGKKGIELAEAKKQGYEPCKVCKAEPETKAVEGTKEKETKDKPKK